MGIDLNSNDGGKKYLSDILSDLLEGINDTYGSVLMDELMNRIEITIKEFNDEMNLMFKLLQNREEERQNMLKMIRSEKSVSDKKEGKSDKNISEWERKLEKIEQSNKG